MLTRTDYTHMENCGWFCVRYG